MKPCPTAENGRGPFSGEESRANSASRTQSDDTSEWKLRGPEVKWACEILPGVFAPISAELHVRHTIINEETLTRTVSELRKTFADSAQSPRVSKTIRGTGYRFVDTVEPAVDEAAGRWPNCVVFAPWKEASLASVVPVTSARWRIEEGFEQVKGVCGLDEYKVRKYEARYRHITLSSLAHRFLATVAAKEQNRRHSKPPDP